MRWSLFCSFEKNIFVPEGARCCSGHMINHRLKTKAANSLAASSVQYKKFNSNGIQLLINKGQLLYERQKRLDFDNSEALSDDEYRIFTGLSKLQFHNLISHISNSDIRNSSNRSIRSAVAILLCKV